MHMINEFECKLYSLTANNCKDARCSNRLHWQPLFGTWETRTQIGRNKCQINMQITQGGRLIKQYLTPHTRFTLNMNASCMQVLQSSPTKKLFIAFIY